MSARSGRLAIIIRYILMVFYASHQGKDIENADTIEGSMAILGLLDLRGQAVLEVT